MIPRKTVAIAIAIAFSLSLGFPSHARAPKGCEDDARDVVVYGGTAGGVIAAVAASRQGKSVVLIEPGRHLGGLTSGGLGATDIGNKAAIGGLARDFYRRVHEHYARDEAWNFEKREEYESARQQPGEALMWTFEPHVAEEILTGLAREAGVEVILGERLDLSRFAERQVTRILRIAMESGRTFAGKVFIDASYEGDLLARAGVSYHVGRESNATYGETLNGVQTRNAVHHQFRLPVDPYVVPGNPASGLLPEISGGPPGTDGEGDRKVQAYNFRICLTDAPANRLPVPKPAGYDARRYELLLRYFEAGFDEVPWNLIAMPNRKTDINNNHAFSTDWIGASHEYPEAGHRERERIVRAHRDYQLGLLWCLANEPRVPEKVRRVVARWGLCKDEFLDHGGWPHQLYVREARRMVGEYVMTEHECRGARLAPDPVGLAAYTMDSHNVQRYVADGRVLNEGDVQVGGFPPYPIAYGAIVPKRGECSNLVVPVCVSASHIAYGSIRMEPVFMVLGESAALAACEAIDEGKAVQDIDRARLRERLLAAAQVLEWKGARPRAASAAGRLAIDPKSLAGIVIDDAEARFEGEWAHSLAIARFVGAGYRHDGDEKKGKKRARFAAEIAEPGTYEVRFAYSAHPNRATNVPVVVRHAGGATALKVDERRAPAIERAFVSLGEFRFEKGEAVVEVSTEGTDGHVVADAVWLVSR